MYRCLFVYTLYRYAKLQVFEASVMKYIVDWADVKILDVRSGRIFTV